VAACERQQEACWKVVATAKTDGNAIASERRECRRSDRRSVLINHQEADVLQRNRPFRAVFVVA